MVEMHHLECCLGTAAERVITRAGLLEYRSWKYLPFMFTFQGSVMHELWKWFLGYGFIGLGWAVTYELSSDWDQWDNVSLEVHKLLAIPIAFLIVFRSNVAHNRFWEGRTHLATLYGTERTIARKANTLIPGDDDEAHALRSNICRFLPVLAVAVKNNLRKRTKGISDQEVAANYRDEISKWLTPEETDSVLIETARNKPLRVIGWIGREISAASRAGKMEGGPPTFASFDNECTRLVDSWMGMNKICFTPTPFPYIHALHWFVFIWLFTLPVALVSTIRWWCPIALAMISCAMYAIEEVAEEIEDPFGDDLNDLPIETIAPDIAFDTTLLNAQRAVVLQKDGIRATVALGYQDVGEVKAHGDLINGQPSPTGSASSPLYHAAPFGSPGEQGSPSGVSSTITEVKEPEKEPKNILQPH